MRQRQSKRCAYIPFCMIVISCEDTTCRSANRRCMCHRSTWLHSVAPLVRRQTKHIGLKVLCYATTDATPPQGVATPDAAAVPAAAFLQLKRRQHVESAKELAEADAARRHRLQHGRVLYLHLGHCGAKILTAAVQPHLAIERPRAPRDVAIVLEAHCHRTIIEGGDDALQIAVGREEHAL